MSRRPAAHLRHGSAAEAAAAAHLRNAGLALKHRNFSCRHGEIDLIMEHRGELVFVEVRYRQDNAYGGAVESIDQSKRRRLRRTADFYLQQHPEQGHRGCRFDIVAVSGPAAAGRCDWIVNAFW